MKRRERSKSGTMDTARKTDAIYGALKWEPSPPLRVWVDNRRRIVSFHEEEGCCLMEFRSWDLFWTCLDQYTGQQYRYQ